MLQSRLWYPWLASDTSHLTVGQSLAWGFQDSTVYVSMYLRCHLMIYGYTRDICVLGMCELFPRHHQDVAIHRYLELKIIQA